MTAPLFTDPDQHLMQNYWPDQPKTTKRQPPWTWAALNAPECHALASMIGDWVSSFNRCYAVEAEQLIPPCWSKHPWLAYELSVLTWLWYSAHRDPTATAERAGEYYLRYLPGFRARLSATLGRSPVECRKGQHPNSWRQAADQAIEQWVSNLNGAENYLADIDELDAESFGFESQTHRPKSAG